MGKARTIANTPNAPVFKVATSSSMSVSTGLSTPTILTPFGTPAFDTASAVVSSPAKFQPSTAGYYQINAIVSYASDGQQASYISCDIVKNGTVYSSAAIASSSATGYPQIVHADVVYLNGSTDYIQVGTRHNGGTAINVSAALSGALVRGA